MAGSFSSRVSFCFFMISMFVFVAAAERRYRLPRHSFRRNYYELKLPVVQGPESLAFDCKGNGPYAGVSDGRILRWHGHGNWVEFAVTSANRNREACDGSRNTSMEPMCGRPLGLRFHPKTCELYVADAYFGLVKVGPNGGVATQLANSAEGIPFKFTNDLDVDPITGFVYFTDSSIHHERRYFDQIIETGDKSGRLLKYDPTTKKVTVLYRGLSFPNGVQLSEDSSHLLLVESMQFQVLKFPLSVYGIGPPQVFAYVDRFPDNIRRNNHGEYWVALNSARSNIEGSSIEDTVGVKLNEYGRVVKVVKGDGSNTLESVSEVEEHNGRLWFGSPVRPYVGTLRN